MTVRILKGDCREVLRDLPDESVHCVVTSPPYWGLRDYGVAGQIGLEDDVSDYVSAMREVFSEVHRVLRPDGTTWLNLGDSYCPENRGENAKPRAFEGYAPQLQGTHFHADVPTRKSMILATKANGIKRKDMIGIPWRVAFALQADGWWLRQDIIWSKPNPMPESVTDRCTKAHEYLFLLSKSERYYFDQESILESITASTVDRLSQATLDEQRGSDRVPGKTNGPMRAVSRKRREGEPTRHGLTGAASYGISNVGENRSMRNKRSVWEIATQPFSEAHFATFPPALIEPCILAGCPKGGTVLDPFGGAGTTGLVADRLGRNAILIELNPEYAAMAERRIKGDAPLFADVETWNEMWSRPFGLTESEKAEVSDQDLSAVKTKE